MRAYLLLLRQPNLKILTKPQWHQELKRLGDANPNRTARAAAARKHTDEFNARDPMYQAAILLCRAAGLSFDRFTAGGHFELDGAMVNGMGLLAAETGDPYVILAAGCEALLFPMKPWDAAAGASRRQGFDAYAAHLGKNPPRKSDNHYRRGEREPARITTDSPLWP